MQSLTPRGPDGAMPNAGLYRALPQSAMGDDAWDTHQHWEPPSSTTEQPIVQNPTSEIAIIDGIDLDAK